MMRVAWPTVGGRHRSMSRVVVPCLLAACAIRFPFATFCVFLSLLTLAGCERRPGRVLVAMLCISAVVVLGPLVALKLPLPASGNDKPQYLDFMYEMRSFGMSHYMSAQPEWISFSSLYVAALLCGETDCAFLLIFVVYFTLLLIAVWRIQYRAIPLFLVLLLSSSSFFGTYGNLLRQAMAFPFLFMMVGARSRTAAVCFMALSGLTHLPALIVGVPYVVHRCIGRWAALAVACVAAFASTLDPALFSVLDGGESYLSSKIGLYQSWDDAGIAGIAIHASAIGSLCCVLHWYDGGWRDVTDRATHAVIRRQFVALMLAAAALVVTAHLTKVFERVYIYFFMMALMYLVLVISQIRRGPWKWGIVCASVAYGIYGLAKNIDGQPLLFRGDVHAYLTSNLADLYREFFLGFE